MKRFIKENWKGLVSVVLIFAVGTLLTAAINRPEPEPVEPPDHTIIIAYDLADYCGELGKMYVVRAEWVYLSRESAEEKREEME